MSQLKLKGKAKKVVARRSIELRGLMRHMVIGRRRDPELAAARNAEVFRRVEAVVIR